MKIEEVKNMFLIDFLWRSILLLCDSKSLKFQLLFEFVFCGLVRYHDSCAVWHEMEISIEIVTISSILMDSKQFEKIEDQDDSHSFDQKLEQREEKKMSWRAWLEI